MAVTTEDIALLRRNLGDTAGAFDEGELANLLNEQGGDQDRALRQGLWELMAQSARWHDYTTDVSQERKSQIFANVQALYAAVNERIVAAERAASEAASGQARAARTVTARVASWF